MKQKVYILYGGQSTEHDVSKRSAAFILKYLNKDKYDVEAIGIDKLGAWHLLPKASYQNQIPDVLPIVDAPDTSRSPLMLSEKSESGVIASPPVIFPIIHGQSGEDGKLQGLLEFIKLPFVGPDCLGSAVAMDKVIAKTLVASVGVKVVDYLWFRQAQWKKNQKSICESCETLGFPLFIKPARGGSSVGIEKVKKPEDLIEKVNQVLKYDDKILVEKGIDGREIEVAALGSYEPMISEPGEVIAGADFYDYEAKYAESSHAESKIPADLSADQTQTVKDLAFRSFVALQLHGMARIDFFLDKKTGEFYFNEANTLPGFTSISQYPLLWKHSGVSGEQLVDKLVELALERFNY